MSEKQTKENRHTGQTAGNIDATNLRILAELRTNGRVSMAQLAEAVGISRASAYSRVEAMGAEGIITGYAATVDPSQAGLGICALVFVTVHPQTWTAFRETVQRMPQVESCLVTTGAHDAMLTIRAGDVASIHEFVVGGIAVRPEVKSVETVLVLDEVFRRPYLLPSDLPERDPGAGPVGLTRFTRADRERRGS